MGHAHFRYGDFAVEMSDGSRIVARKLEFSFAMNSPRIAGLLLLVSFCLHAQPREPFPLWPNGAPGALGKEDKDIPTLAPYFPTPQKATGAAFVICPGGGYGGLAPHEGRDYALWLNEQGIAGFVLKYRLGPAGYKHPAMMSDVNRAIRYVRAKAGEWKLDAKRIGVMGSSAGGHLASTALTHYNAGKPDTSDPVEKVSSRPDLGILCYAVISMGPNTHAGSKNNLLGKEPSAELVQLLSNELQVTKDTPPCFIWHTWEDSAVKVENSLDFAAALRKNGVPFSLHIYPKGRHGLGLGTGQWDPESRHPWTRECALWLKEQKFSAP
jgi:acetyl esterase/lipase